MVLSKRLALLIPALACASALLAQPWREHPEVFSASGIPSFNFSTPRFADLDADGHPDLVLGGADVGLVFLRNEGNLSRPRFALAPENIFEHISALDAVVADFGDFDGDGDLDMVAGGFRGLSYYQNQGDPQKPRFVADSALLAGLQVGIEPIPSLGDVNADGLLDIMVGLAEDGTLRYYPNSGTRGRPSFREQDKVKLSIDMGLFAYPFLADFDRDDDLDLIVGNDESDLKFYKNFGTPQQPQWRIFLETFAQIPEEHFFICPALVDLDHDAYLELVYGHYEGTVKYFQNEGFNVEPVWVENDILFGGTVSVGTRGTPCLFDHGQDGDMDLLAGNAVGELLFFENTGSAREPRWTEAPLPLPELDLGAFVATASADLNGDGLADLLVADRNRHFHALRQMPDGGWQKLENPFATPPAQSQPTLALADIDGDKDNDLLLGDADGRLHLFENVGTRHAPRFEEKPGFFADKVFTTHSAAVAAADFDGDGDTDILLSRGAHIGKFAYFQNVGTEREPRWLERSNLFDNVETGTNPNPAAIDFDGDGDLDLVVGESSGNFSYFENLRVR